MLTPRIALAPSLDLFGVPSRSKSASSSSDWIGKSRPSSAGAICSRTFATAFSTPLPRYRFLSPSRSSSASPSPVEAPEGTIALPVTSSPESSTSTVGKPRESRTSRATIFLIFTRFAFPFELVTGADDGLDVSADVEVAHDLHLPRIEQLHEVVHDEVDDF